MKKKVAEDMITIFEEGWLTEKGKDKLLEYLINELVFNPGKSFDELK